MNFPNLSRSVTAKIVFLLDECLPPFLRDSKWLLWPIYRLAFGKAATHFFTFKDNGLTLSETEFQKVYEQMSAVRVQRETDLNDECIREIESHIAGKTVLEVGCGRGHLANVLHQTYEVTASDIRIMDTLVTKYPDIRFERANIQALPFADGEFDTVVCTHTLEHVQDIVGAIAELRRVTGQRLIVVVPKQRSYRYTFDLHLHFFPYEHSLHSLFAPTNTRRQRVCTIAGDLYLQEDKVER